MVMNAIVESKQLPQYQQIQAYVGGYLLRLVMTIWQNKPKTTDFQNANPMNKADGITPPLHHSIADASESDLDWFSVSNVPCYLLWVVQSLVSFRIQTINFRIPHYLLLQVYEPEDFLIRFTFMEARKKIHPDPAVGEPSCWWYSTSVPP